MTLELVEGLDLAARGMAMRGREVDRCEGRCAAFKIIEQARADVVLDANTCQPRIELVPARFFFAQNPIVPRDVPCGGPEREGYMRIDRVDMSGVLVGAGFQSRADPVRDLPRSGVEIEDDAADTAERRGNRADRRLPVIPAESGFV